MGSLILFVLGLAAPFAAAIALMWQEERRRSYLKMRFDRMAQDNRGLKLALNNTRQLNAAGSASTGGDRREVAQLLEQLEKDGILLDWLRLATRPPAEASARLLGVNEQQASALHQAIADWGSQGVVAALDQLKGRLAAVAEMEMVWADPHAHLERDSNAMLERTLWVFEPEYVMGEGRVALDPRYGAVAKPVMGAGLVPGPKEGEPALVVELKNARVTVGGDQQLQAWNNVRELIRGGAIRERDPVDVFVVGGAVDELDGNPRIEGRYRNVRITSYDYGQLIARAKRLTFGLYDQLKDAAPFLSQHREAISAAQQAAVEQAASEASEPAPAPEEEELRRGADENDHIRHEEFADAPRRTGFEGDHVVIGQRKNAAQ